MGEGARRPPSGRVDGAAGGSGRAVGGTVAGASSEAAAARAVTNARARIGYSPLGTACIVAAPARATPV